MRVHNDEHRYVAGSLKTGRYAPISGVVGTYVRPTLTEQGIDVDRFIQENYALIQKLMKGNR